MIGIETILYILYEVYIKLHSTVDFNEYVAKDNIFGWLAC